MKFLRKIKLDKNRKIRNWFAKNINNPKAEKAVYAVSFFDSFILPIPPDPFLAIITVLKPQKWLKFAFYTMLFGVIGGTVGYLGGYFLFEISSDKFLHLYDSYEKLQSLKVTFDDNTFTAIFLAAFTPIPYRIFTVAGGIFQINYFIFILASILGRGLRFFIVACIMKFVGENFGKLILKYLNLILLFTGIAILAYLIF